MEKLGGHNLERLPNERIGHWAERLLIHIINVTGTGKAERATGDEDRHGVDIWIKIENRRREVPVDLTLLKVDLSPHPTDEEGNERVKKMLEEKRANALRNGHVLFEASNRYGISIDDFYKAGQGGRDYQEKIIMALDESITNWAKRIDGPFVTREDVAREVEHEGYLIRQQRKQRQPSQRRGKGFYRRRKQRQSDKE